MKIIISGGGTGGHIFPAIAIAKALQGRVPDCEILFIGASKRMEMQKVPQEGYKIIGLPVEGFVRKVGLANFRVIFKLLISLIKARNILRNFKPDVVIGVGGFASGPVLRMAIIAGIPTLIQEQNSYAGITNKLLAKKARRICVAYPGMEKYFPAQKIVITGNPVRKDILNAPDLNDAFNHFGFRPNYKTILVLGGSLGALTINRSISKDIEKFLNDQVQVLWQTGKYYINEAEALSKTLNSKYLKVVEFVKRMDYAFAIADVVISRAGAGTISELCLTHKPVILVPSPNVAEDHQTKNAMALVEKHAAMMVSDADAMEHLSDKAMNLINNEVSMQKLSDNIKELAYHNSDELIVDEILKLV